ncbi:MAG: 50S ribosomal protein L32 [Spirochaetota bacterium]
MAVPKRKKSKSKSRMRQANKAIVVPNLRPCPKCGAYTMPHRVCPECMHYKGIVVAEKKVRVTEV